jgi:hypothetical protein
VSDDYTTEEARHVLIGAGADRAGANVLPFPPRPQHVAHLVQLAEETASADLLPTARAALNAAHRQRHQLAARTANLHRVYAALLMCCRLLDEAAYPWEAMRPGDMSPPSLPLGGAA